MSKLKKPRNYSDFTLDHLQEIFGVRNQITDLNLTSYEITPSDWLKLSLEKSQLIPTFRVKAKSELLVMPVLVELTCLNVNKFNLFSGYTFDVDSSQALKGQCGFILTKSLSLYITTPIIIIFEAKDDNLHKWVGQCGSQMYAARLFNQMKHEPVDIIHGAVTNGYQWLFLRLENNILWVNRWPYSLHNLAELLGVWQKVIDFYN